MDDSLLVGHEKAIQEAINDLKNEGFDLTLDETLDDYLSCEISFDRKKNMAWIHQPYLFTKLIKKFGEHTKGLQIHSSICTSMTIIKVRQHTSLITGVDI